MKHIHFATTNKAKIISLNRNFEGVDIDVVSVEIEIPEPRSDETKVIAHEKVLYAFDHIGKPCIAQDGGFYIPALNGFPKAYVNFAMETIGNKGILKLISGLDRSCEFRDTVAYMDETLDEPVFFETITRGRLAEEERGELGAHNWGEIHKIFIPEGKTKTFAEMTAEEMGDWSSNRKGDDCGCVRKFALWLKNNIVN